MNNREYARYRQREFTTESEDSSKYPCRAETGSREFRHTRREDTQYGSYKSRKRSSPEPDVVPPARREAGTSHAAPLTRKARKKERRLDLPPFGQPGALNDPLRRGMSGAKCRWYLRFLNQGMSPEEAKKNALNKRPFLTTPKAVKKAINNKPSRNSSREPDETNNIADIGNNARRQKEAAYSGNPRKDNTVAILPVNYPSVVLKKTEQSDLESALLYAVENAESPFRGALGFANITFRRGIVLVTCLNDRAVLWLYETIPRLARWQGPPLKTATGDDIPAGKTIVIFFPGSAGVDGPALLNLLEAQNEGLETLNWDILKLADERNGRGRLVMFIVDERCAELVTQRNALNYRFGTAPVCVLKNIVRGEQIKEEVIDFDLLGSFDGSEHFQFHKNL